MPSANITLAYKQVIDSTAAGLFEQQVLHASYMEYLLKSQTYNPQGKFKTFTELKAHDGRANSLHYKTGFAADGYISTLNKQIPHLHTTLDQSVAFSTYQFEVIESDITDKSRHKIAITYFTGPLILHAVIGNYLLLSDNYNVNETEKEIPSTYLIELQKFLSINSYSDLFLNSHYVSPP